MDGRVPLILLSGMGADGRLFREQRGCFPNLITPDWIPHRRGDTLASYAERMARHIDPGCPCYVGGASFGGMVALEIARHSDEVAQCEEAMAACPVEAIGNDG